jgi:hypothetical protein
VVLLDRFGTNVVSWLDPVSGDVLAQLPVGTGFESNPQDYLEVSDELALVTRWGQNGDPGRQPYDTGGDLLLVDLVEREIAGHLVMPAPDGLPARPGPIARVGDELVVTLDRIALDFANTAEAMLVGVDRLGTRVLWQEKLSGRKGCGRATLSPDRSKLVVACSGALNPAGEIEDIAQSALLVFDASTRPLRQLRVFEAPDLLAQPLQASVQFADDDLVLLKTQTSWGGVENNQLFLLDVTSGATHALLEADADDEGNSKGLVYGGMACSPGCSDTCLLADADQGVVQRIRRGSGGEWSVLTPTVVERRVGLPPVDVSPR